jgi:hypothetical protein
MNPSILLINKEIVDMNESGLCIWGLIWVFVWGGVGYFIAKGKGNNPWTAAVLCIFLGVIGVLIVAIQSKNEKALLQGQLSKGEKVLCKFCAEPINPAAKVCPHCQKELF